MLHVMLAVGVSIVGYGAVGLARDSLTRRQARRDWLTAHPMQALEHDDGTVDWEMTARVLHGEWERYATQLEAELVEVQRNLDALTAFARDQMEELRAARATANWARLQFLDRVQAAEEQVQARVEFEVVRRTGAVPVVGRRMDTGQMLAITAGRPPVADRVLRS